MSVNNCHVVIPAAGSGERFASQTPKQFCRINGWPIITHTVEKFVRESCVQNVVVVAPQCGENKMKAALSLLHTEHERIFVTPGASTRHRSIYRGLQRLKQILEATSRWEDEIVIVHDGVRPFVKPADIQNIVAAAAKHKAAGIIKPLVSTVLSITNDDILQNSLDRSTHYSSEMPQSFQLGPILNAYNKCTEYELNHGTECLQLAFEYGGVAPKLIHGDPNDLWKITYEHEILAATALLKSSKKILLVTPHENNMTNGMHLPTADSRLEVCKASDLDAHIKADTAGVIYLLPKVSEIPSCTESILQSSSCITKEYGETLDFAVVFLVETESCTSSSEKAHKTFRDIAKRACGLLFHIVIATVSDLSKSQAFKNAIDLAENHHPMLNGQTLYFDV